MTEASLKEKQQRIILGRNRQRRHATAKPRLRHIPCSVVIHNRLWHGTVVDHLLRHGNFLESGFILALVNKKEVKRMREYNSRNSGSTSVSAHHFYLSYFFFALLSSPISPPYTRAFTRLARFQF